MTILCLLFAFSISVTVDRFGSSVGDVGFTNDDDSFRSQLVLPREITYHGAKESVVWVNLNGIFTFGTSYQSFVPVRLPLSRSIISPYWTDIDLRGRDPPLSNTPINTMYYRLSRNSDDIAHFVEQIPQAMKDKLGVFSPDLVVVGTWKDVGYYPEKVDKLATFQLVLLNSEGPPERTVIIYNYEKLGFTVGSANSNNPPVMGYASPKSGVEHSNSRSNSLPGALLSGSNCGTPGRWVYRVDSGVSTAWQKCKIWGEPHLSLFDETKLTCDLYTEGRVIDNTFYSIDVMLDKGVNWPVRKMTKLVNITITFKSTQTILRYGLSGYSGKYGGHRFSNVGSSFEDSGHTVYIESVSKLVISKDGEDVAIVDIKDHGCVLSLAVMVHDTLEYGGAVCSIGCTNYALSSLLSRRTINEYPECADIADSGLREMCNFDIQVTGNTDFAQASKWSEQIDLDYACSPGCSPFMIGDGKCDPVCNSPACGNDGGDCGSGGSGAESSNLAVIIASTVGVAYALCFFGLSMTMITILSVCFLCCLLCVLLLIPVVVIVVIGIALGLGGLWFKVFSGESLKDKIEKVEKVEMEIQEKELGKVEESEIDDDEVIPSEIGDEIVQEVGVGVTKI